MLEPPVPRGVPAGPVVRRLLRWLHDAGPGRAWSGTVFAREGAARGARTCFSMLIMLDDDAPWLHACKGSRPFLSTGVPREVTSAGDGRSPARSTRRTAPPQTLPSPLIMGRPPRASPTFRTRARAARRTGAGGAVVDAPRHDPHRKSAGEIGAAPEAVSPHRKSAAERG